jgi:hypothetical protein
MNHHAQLFVFFFFEIGFCCVVQASLQLLGSTDLLTSVSQVAQLTVGHLRAWFKLSENIGLSSPTTAQLSIIERNNVLHISTSGPFVCMISLTHTWAMHRHPLFIVLFL